ncbi:hypothetical protein Scep_021420 [Stephania cephalantha]|uniref:PORR domain-containing protein n=1 Tax=Stephania cephalantha TaxID=152367 RepID=A0AAP0F4K1_9MAGN
MGPRPRARPRCREGKKPPVGRRPERPHHFLALQPPPTLRHFIPQTPPLPPPVPPTSSENTPPSSKNSSPRRPPSRPHVRLTHDALLLHRDELSVYDRDSYRQDAADRLLKLLMLTNIKKLPIKLIDQLRWDLGLPQDYVKGLVVDYPDYFEVSPMRIVNEEEVLGLEVVCWIDELGVSEMERKARKEPGRSYVKGMPIVFKGFDMEKKVKKWVDDWQKLPYISPYEDASHLDSKSDQAEKWTVAVLHEFLNLLISKKTEKDNILCVGDQLGLRSRFRRALVNHPGIFYVSNKIRTHTAVLREGYKRDLLVEKHPLMGMRYQYIHLMNKGKEQVQSSGASSSSSARRQGTSDAKLEEEEGEFLGSEVEESGEDENGYDSNVSDDEEEDEDEDEKNVPNRRAVGGESRASSRIRSRESSRSPHRKNSKGSYRNRSENNLSMVSGRREPRNRRGNGLRA